MDFDASPVATQTSQEMHHGENESQNYSQTQRQSLVQESEDDSSDEAGTLGNRDMNGNPLQRRNIYFRPKELAANCYCVRDETKQLISLQKYDDGSTFTFVAKMTSTAALPPETMKQILAVNTILFSEDVEEDIVNDADLHTTIDKGVVIECRTSKKRTWQQQDESVLQLWEMDNFEIMQVQKQILDHTTGKEKTETIVNGVSSNAQRPIANGRMFVTVHEVTYDNNQMAKESFFAAVLWVVCHRKFDFVGKLSRLFEDPNKWRKPNLSKSRGKTLTLEPSIMEKSYQLWCDVLEHQGQLMCIGHACREIIGETSVDAVKNITEIYNPDSFFINTCPLMAHIAICNLAPENAQNVNVEGMDAAIVTGQWQIRMRQYVERFRAWRVQLKRFRYEQEKEQKKKSEANKRNKRNSRVDNQAENENIEQADEDGDDHPYIEELEYDYDVPEIMGVLHCGEPGDGQFVRDCLLSMISGTDEEGCARLPYLPGWPVHFDQSVNMFTDDVAHCKVRLCLDLKAIRPILAGILQSLNEKQFALYFGEIPQSARESMDDRIFALKGSLPSSLPDFEFEHSDDLIHMTQLDRRNVHDRATNPKKSILENKTYATDFQVFLATVLPVATDNQNVMRLHGYVDKMFHTMQNDIMCGKSHSKVFESTQLYLESVETSLVQSIKSVLDKYDDLDSVQNGSDFERCYATSQEIWETCNASIWGLEPQNMLLMQYFFLSELAWRHGTFGNWVWIGMTVQVSDAGGLTQTMCGNMQSTNIKKSGTAGYDLCRNVFNNIRSMYRYFIPETILKRFPVDDHVDKGSAKMTPGSVAEGTIVLLDDKMTKGPGDVGKVRHFPEGFGDHSVINALVPVIPRDNNPGFVLSSTSDINNDNLRQKMTTISIDGLACTIGTCAQNQMPEWQALLRHSDLMRVFSVIATSGPAQTIVVQKRKVNRYDENSSFAGACHPIPKRGRVFAASENMTDKQARKLAPFFSGTFLIASRVALAQKYGILNHDISPPVNFLLQTCYQRITSLLSCLISIHRLEHTNRVFDTAKLLIGISKTVWTRTHAQCQYGPPKTVSDVTKTVFRQQHFDALHFSMVPSVIMRYLVSVLDFQTLAVMQMLLCAGKIPKLSLLSAAQFLRGQVISSSRDKALLRKFISHAVDSRLFGKRGSLGTVCEASNMDYYVTVERNERIATPLRVAYVRHEVALVLFISVLCSEPISNMDCTLCRRRIRMKTCSNASG